ncbi:MAG: glycosyltransferase [Chloroflexota bacterium]
MKINESTIISENLDPFGRLKETRERRDKERERLDNEPVNMFDFNKMPCTDDTDRAMDSLNAQSPEKTTEIFGSAPEFSVIVPVYREEKILDRHLSQFTPELRSKFNFELIVSDGGSEDATVEIAKKHTELVALHTEKRRQTIAEGRNRGAELAKSDTLVFINADTFPKDVDSFLSYIRHWAGSDSAETALACYVDCFEEERGWREKAFYGAHNLYVSALNRLGLGMGRGECQIVRKNAFRTVGGYNSKVVAGEDFDLYRRLAKIGRIKFEKNLVVLESPRRFKKYGYMRTVWFWTINSLAVMIMGKSVSKEWEAVR